MKIHQKKAGPEYHRLKTMVKRNIEQKRFQGSTFNTISIRRLIEDRDTILELTARIQELQNEVNCMNDSRDFKDAAAEFDCRQTFLQIPLSRRIQSLDFQRKTLSHISLAHVPIHTPLFSTEAQFHYQD